MATIFIDANIPMYVGGSQHPLRAPSIEVMQLAQIAPHRFVTDAEVLQEILHRYKATQRWALGLIVFETFLEAMRGRIAPMLVQDVELAASLVTRHPRLSARDAIHAAVMQRLGITRIATTDGGFQGVPGIERLDPARIDEWRDSVR
jgi:predicted nucleic acid-binding protein